ncbi:MAG: hypothetical protein L0227_05415, partial [Chloroflexi bacterium]|nr:hypothetical protein [Chloroflexota bacterium]
GGVVTPWNAEWEVVTTSPVLSIMVPPGQSLTQWYELWSAGGCQRRCDGRVNVLTDEPCLCPVDPEERRAGASANPPSACKPTTRLNVMLPEIPDLGVWRLESHGFYAAVELAGAAEILAYASASGHPIAARLRLDQRDKKVPGKPTNHYAVPVIEFVETRLADLLGAGAPPARQLAGPAVRHEGPEADLPETSDFRAPLPGNDERPATDDPGDLAGREVAPSRAAGDVPTAPEGLSQDELIAKLNAARVSLAYAVETAKIAFPDRPDGVSLTAAQRAELWDRIEARLADGL